jgi:hypothetical protein
MLKGEAPVTWGAGRPARNVGEVAQEVVSAPGHNPSGAPVLLDAGTVC